MKDLCVYMGLCSACAAFHIVPGACCLLLLLDSISKQMVVSVVHYCCCREVEKALRHL